VLFSFSKEKSNSKYFEKIVEEKVNKSGQNGSNIRKNGFLANLIIRDSNRYEERSIRNET